MNTPDYNHWWKHSASFKIAGGKTEPRPGLELWFRLVWQPIEPVAWAYELVRRRPLTKAKMTEAERGLILSMPSWQALTIDQQDCIAQRFPEERRQRPARHVNKQLGYKSLVPGYTVPQPISLDADRMSDADIVDLVRKSGLGEPKQRSGFNQNQKRSPDWWLIEELEQQQLFPKKREEAFAEARYFVPSISSGWLLARNTNKRLDIAFDWPYLKGFSGTVFEFEQVKEVIRSVLTSG